MAIIIPANSAADTAYEVANSCRFEDGDTAHFTRTTETPTNVDKYTFSVWVKRGNLGIANTKLFSIADGTYGEEKLEFNVDDIIWRKTDPDDGCADYERYTDRKFRDSSAWYHILVAYDSSDGTAGDRMKMYINGVQETSFSGSINPDLNENSHVNTASKTLYIGKFKGTGQPFDGYMAEVAFVDGVAHAVTDFGEFDSDSPTIWKPKDISSGITWGNNGFWLDFEDSSALGNDVSGNNNDLTAVNLAAVDQCTDTPTNNFCTMNLLDNFYASYTFSEGNCKIDGTASPTTYRTGTMGVASGKWYWEVNITAAPASNASRIGFTSVVSTSTTHILGSDIYGWAQNGNNGNIEGQASQSGSAASTSYGNSHTTDDIIGIALNLDDDEVKFYKNGTVENSGTAFQINKANAPNGFFFPAIGEASTSNSITAIANFGNPAWALSSAVNDENGYGNFEYSVPSGFLALCTKNLGSDGG